MIKKLKDLEGSVQEQDYDVLSVRHDLNECWILADHVGEPVISGKLKLRIQQIVNQIRSLDQDQHLSQLSDDDLQKQIEQLQKEQERRKNDKNSQLPGPEKQ